MNLSARLAGIPELRGLEIIGRLSGGGTWNDTWLAARGGQRIVLRLDTPAVHALGLNRAHEAEILRSAGRLGLGPELLFSDARRGVLATRWLSGRACASASLRNPRLLRALGETLRRLHETVPPPAGMAPLDLFRAIGHYAAIVGGVRARTTARAARRSLMAAASGKSREPALCHNDPVAQNILRGPPPVLIDWEFAAPGDPLFDLAVVIGHHGLGANQAQTLLSAARGRAYPSERRALARLVDGYAGVRLLWEAAARAVMNRSGQGGRIAPGRAILYARLP